MSMTLASFIPLLYVLSIICTGILAMRKHRFVIGWVLLAFIPFIPLVIVLCLPPLEDYRHKVRRENAEQDLRVCPHCAEMIQRAAKVCKHCGRDVEPENAPMRMICPNCNEGIPIGSVFCPHCKKSIM